jgi:glycolate oxidase FAD binding subunit
MQDSSEQLIAQILDARRAGRRLRIVGGGSKAFIGREADGEALDAARHCGIVAYAPGELVLTARAGTQLSEIEAALDAHGQMLSFEPPRFGDGATLGGTLACNSSGPARPWGGSARDMVLGVELINGRGERLRFGGQVMKNVAGFDVARLQAGALGAFGLVTEVSLKVLPRPAAAATRVLELDAAAALARFAALAGRPEPLSGAAWHEGRAYLRFAGAASAVAAAARRCGGEALADAETFWRDLREQRLPFFAGSEPLWRFSVKPTAALADFAGAWLVDWGGAQRWIRGRFDPSELERAAEAAGGHVCLFRGGDRSGEVNHTLPEALKALHLRLKQAFDPDGVFNPGRLYSWL